ncbi:aromatic ring-opening dioxygenase subunit LigA [Sphingomonas sp. So64.6b]|uniref:aromatic ring-opening dioxygenase subunit LigA n=1 Tax=Sphingomonas sp. So64.6b TaxID=2997354 RepID=UPI00160281DF|nr:aromatic ring-opening dioxygenase subunit LigA [Sphingomonas sp. So64.6b]QNA85502.1 aromatic ring-opening dioxygenase subunit LigA [Sphingomonas sp. So64.6b]
MSLYTLSKLLFELNRDEALKAAFVTEPTVVVDRYRLTDDERQAVLEPDIGLLYVLGVNGQILMHYAAQRGIEWSDYLQRMRDGVKMHGPVRAGIYAMTTRVDEKVAGA